VATSIARPRAPRLWFASYPDPGVPPWLAARISWDGDDGLEVEAA
jgi:hypothetical protein